MLATYPTRIEDRNTYRYFEAMGELFGRLLLDAKRDSR